MTKKVYTYTFTCDACGKVKTVESETEMARGDTPDGWIPLFVFGKLYVACCNRCHTTLFRRAGKGTLDGKTKSYRKPIT